MIFTRSTQERRPRRRQDVALARAGGAKVCRVIDRRERWPFTRLDLDEGRLLRYGDDKRMGKAYVTRAGEYASISCWDSQEVDIVSAESTLEHFLALSAGHRMQTGVFLGYQSALTANGNEHADEILFDAGLHPEAPRDGLLEQERRRLFASIGSVIAWAIFKVEKAARTTDLEARDQMMVNGTAGKPCLPARHHVHAHERSPLRHLLPLGMPATARPLRKVRPDPLEVRTA
jgi:formamidopyrimidine-DNA glycosylase